MLFVYLKSSQFKPFFKVLYFANYDEAVQAMRTLLALVIPLVFAKLDLSHVRAPGMYPPEETRTDVPDIPLNSYQMTMTDISGDFNNYQYYYEKDPTPASKDSDGHGSVNKGPIPPQTSEVRQQINVSTSYANIQGGPPTVDDTSPLQYVSPPSRPSTENKKTDEAVEWTPQQNRPASPSDVGDVYRDRPQYSNFDEKIAIKVPVKTDSYKQDDTEYMIRMCNQSKKTNCPKSNRSFYYYPRRKQYGSVKNIISNQQKRIHSSNDFERRQSFDRTTNSYDERPHTGNTRTQINSEWTNSRIATNDGYVGKVGIWQESKHSKSVIEGT
ncbi:hypothetical protein DICVIV_00247 [Dictyocaulus viviparus]|uniref:Uncharacterized protein n=1 Tax=Dictyocaulus viviparus TaxID=29172 RepID=A0A0D8YBS8_DICVI|nr:hypothetical protein DICVIV_00247 [Dictyocaulus viviparus]